MVNKGMRAISVEEAAGISATMNDPCVRYAQRVRFFFYSCKECLAGSASPEMARRLDMILTLAIHHREEWHDYCWQLLVEAVFLDMLHRDDCTFFLAQLMLCVPGKEDKPPAPSVRRVGQSRAY